MTFLFASSFKILESFQIPINEAQIPKACRGSLLQVTLHGRRAGQALVLDLPLAELNLSSQQKSASRRLLVGL